MPALQTLCKQHGHGLDVQYLDVLRQYILSLGLNEKEVTMGYSYYKNNGGKRVMKIMKTGDKLYLEFNSYVNGNELIYLSNQDREFYHAGGVVACYVGNSTQEAKDIIGSLFTQPDNILQL